MFAATLRLLGLTDSVRAVDVAVIAPDGSHVPGFDASRPANSATTVVIVPNTVGGILLAAANVARRKLIVHNKSGRTIYIAFEATAAVATASFPVANNNVWEGDLNGYTGDVSAICTSGSGDVNVTEVTT
jgi:hypothetical protein